MAVNPYTCEEGSRQAQNSRINESQKATYRHRRAGFGGALQGSVSCLFKGPPSHQDRCTFSETYEDKR